MNDIYDLTHILVPQSYTKPSPAAASSPLGPPDRHSAISLRESMESQAKTFPKNEMQGWVRLIYHYISQLASYYINIISVLYILCCYNDMYYQIISCNHIIVIWAVLFVLSIKDLVLLKESWFSWENVCTWTSCPQSNSTSHAVCCNYKASITSWKRGIPFAALHHHFSSSWSETKVSEGLRHFLLWPSLDV